MILYIINIACTLELFFILKNLEKKDCAELYKYFSLIAQYIKIK